MNLFNINKKILNISRRAILLFLISSTVIFPNIILAESDLNTITELQQKINSTNQIKSDLEKEIALYEKQLRELGAQKDSLTNTLKTIDINAKKISTDIKLTENSISATQYRINELSSDISDKNQKINTNTDVLKSSLRDLNYRDDSSIIVDLLKKEDFSVVWSDIQNIKIFQSKIKDQTNQVINDKNVLVDRKTESEKKKKELLTLKSQLQDKKTILDANKKEKNKILTETKNQESGYKKILAEKKAKMEAFEKELASYESALKIAIDPNSIPKAGKGILSWPLNNIKITQLFGKTSDSVRLYSSGTHNGVDFAASIGTPVKAALSGVIQGVGDTDKTCDGASYGKWILIKHNNGLSTLYGHFSLIKVQPGQTVATGEIIGYSGNTGYSTGPHLHLSVYATQGVKISNLKSTVCRGTYTMPIADPKAYLDPMIYL